MSDWRIWSKHVSPDNLIQNVLMDQDTFEFLYCAKTEKREGLSFFFWIAPFDKTSWLFIRIFIVTLIGLIHGNWFEIYAILMRQECRILTGNRKFLIIFIATIIVLTYGYEGMISSLVTVAPPVMGHNKLKSLLDGG